MPAHVYLNTGLTRLCFIGCRSKRLKILLPGTCQKIIFCKMSVTVSRRLNSIRKIPGLSRSKQSRPSRKIGQLYCRNKFSDMLFTSLNEIIQYIFITDKTVVLFSVMSVVFNDRHGRYMIKPYFSLDLYVF